MTADNLRRLLLLVALALGLSACAGGPPRRSSEAESPLSQQQMNSGDPQRRAKVHTELGSMYLSDGRYATALDEARIAVEADSNYAPAFNLLGLVHMYLRENPLAEENFERAVRLAPGDAEIANNYGWFLCQSGQAQRSIPYFQKAMHNPLYTTPAKPLTNAGVCSLKFNDDAAAEDFLTKSLRIDNSNATALYWLADIDYRHDRFDQALKRVEAVHHLTDVTAASAWLGFRIAHKLGDRGEEARYFGLMRRKFADSPEFQKLKRGQYE